jgi:protein tyrosine/serine phosphatase
LHTQHLDWDHSINARDLGGVRIRTGPLSRGVLVRSDSLSALSDDGWAALHDHGVRTVVDLRSDNEAEREPVRPAHGVAYRRIPIIDVLPAADPDRPQTMPEWGQAYALMLDRFREGFAAAVSAIADAQPGGVAVHCRVGRDRTGLVIALLLSLAGASREEIHDDYAISFDRLAPAFEEWIRDAPDDRMRARLQWESAPPSDLILHALDHLDERYGGVEPYLSGAGVDVERARARLGEPE